MLQGIHPLLGPDLLYCLSSMGHGDEIAIVDGNYPAEAHAQRLIRCDGHSLILVLDAILSVFPIDDSPNAISHAVNINDNPKGRDEIHSQMIEAVQNRNVQMAVTAQQPDSFYQRVKSCFAIVATSEPALHGNIILRKGVIRLKS